MPFVHLHLHSEYSLLDGCCRIADIPKAAKAAGHSAVAITDHGAMFGVVDFFRACVKEGVKPIIGCEIYMAARTMEEKTHELDSECYHLVLLVKNDIGYRNLIKIVSDAYTDGFYSKPRADIELLEKHSDGLVALSACLGGRIPQYILAGDYEKAKDYALKLDNIFGRGNFYLELQNHGIDGQNAVLNGLVQISRDTGIPMAATNDVHYLKKSEADLQNVLMCIQTGTTTADGRPKAFETDEFYFKSTEEMTALFSKYEGAIENTQKIADMCDFKFEFDKKYLPTFKPEDGSTPEAKLKELALAGLKKRVADGFIVYDEKYGEDDYKSRVTYELFIINRMGYNEYFLIVRDFVSWAKEHNIPTGPGRGSGAGSLVSFLIDITEVDPIKHNLLFERFLNPERVSMPDFDIDFCYERRDKVIDYVAERYGHDHVSQIITFGTMAARAVVRDVGRALGMSYGDVDAVAKKIPQFLGVTLKDALTGELKEMYDSSPQIKTLMNCSAALEGMPRHMSTHAAGVVITDAPVADYVPLAVSSGAVITQFSMDTIADLGLLKFDFLALRYLTIISDTEKMIRKSDPDFSIRRIPEDDADTYALISSGKTDGVFQLESAGMKQLLANFRPSTLEDIMISIALYRPGPMDSIPKFIENRKKGKLEYPILQLADILDETSGVIIYQEQVMRIFRAVANYSFGKADIIRRIMSKKKTGELEKERDTFIEGAKRNFIDENAASALFDEMAGFARYAFNKSHAAAYSVTSYRTAYLKCHHPREYLAALLTSVLGNMPKMTEYIVECGHRGIKVLPPDVNESDVKFTVADGNIRFGMLALKNVGQSFVEAVIIERAHGKFASFNDFIARMSAQKRQGGEISKKPVEALIKSGAFDLFGIYRSRLLAVYEQLIEDYTKRERANLEGQLDMFGGVVSEEAKFPEVEELSVRERIMMEKEAAGFCFSGHMLDYYTRNISRYRVVEMNEIIVSFEEGGAYKEKQLVKVAGILTKRTVKNTKNDEAMAFITLEDRYAEMEIVVFPKLFAKAANALSYDAAICVTGELSVKEEEPPKLLAREIIMLVNNDAYKDDIKNESFANDPPQRQSANRSYTQSPQPINQDAPYTQNSPPAQNPPAVQNPQPIQNSPATQPKKPKTLYLRLDKFKGVTYSRVMNLLDIFEGYTPVMLYNLQNKEYSRRETGSEVSEFLISELNLILGAENVVYK